MKTKLPIGTKLYFVIESICDHSFRDEKYHFEIISGEITGINEFIGSREDEFLSGMKIDIPVPKAAVTQRKRNTALDMAINALSCSEIPNSSDSVSRQAAIEALEEQISLCDKALKSFGISMKDEYAVKVERSSLAAYKEQLEAMPAADVATVVHGYWFIDERPESDRRVTCSVCEEPVFRYLDPIDWRPKYCPHCGAKMDGYEL